LGNWAEKAKLRQYCFTGGFAPFFCLSSLYEEELMNQVGDALQIMVAAGFDDEEILRLMQLKYRVTSGLCSDLTIEYKRASFVKYLYVEGRVES
jgi:hypothetical protein